MTIQDIHSVNDIPQVKVKTLSNAMAYAFRRDGILIEGDVYIGRISMNHIEYIAIMDNNLLRCYPLDELPRILLDYTIPDV